VLGMFILAPANPEHFLKIATAFSVIPPGFWALMSIIVGFYFGGRMQLKSQDFQVTASTVKAAGDLVRARQDLAALFAESDEPVTEKKYQAAMKDTAIPLSNRVIEEWNRRNGPGG